MHIPDLRPLQAELMRSSEYIKLRLFFVNSVIRSFLTLCTASLRGDWQVNQTPGSLACNVEDSFQLYAGRVVQQKWLHSQGKSLTRA